MKNGEVIKARTNAMFLNELLGKELKQYYKGRYLLSSGMVIWMIRIDNRIRHGWSNCFDGENRIIETYENVSITNTTDRCDRVVFDIREQKKQRDYVFMGIYRYSEEESRFGKNVLIKISECFCV